MGVCQFNLYAVIIAFLNKNGMNCGSVRKPLPGLAESDKAIVEAADGMIKDAIAKYC